MLTDAGLWTVFGFACANCVGLTLGLRALASYGVVSTNLARRLTHMTVGLAYVAHFPLFGPYGVAGMYAAAIIPLGITASFVALGLGVVKDKPLLAMLSRSNRQAEVFHGPIQYGLLFVATTVLGWKNANVVAALITLCAGDAMAATIGQRYGTLRYSWNGKSLQGTLAFIVCSLLFCAAELSFLAHAGFLSHISWLQVVISVLAASVAEAFSPSIIDNTLIVGSSLLASQMIAQAR
eukprot:m.57850 g.57850  ORF g.57850 m.57850 type:complete len:237 (-) comp11638_c0_seq1:123-833(-)